MGDPGVRVYRGVGNVIDSSRCDTTSRCKIELSTLTVRSREEWILVPGSVLVVILSWSLPSLRGVLGLPRKPSSSSL